MICNTILSPDAGQRQRAIALSHPCDHEGKQLILLQPFCTGTTILFFTFSGVFNK